MLTPSQEYRRTATQTPKELPKGLDAFVNAWVGRYARREGQVLDLVLEAHEIRAQSERCRRVSDHRIRDALVEYRKMFRRSLELPPDIERRAFALLVEVADRQLGYRPFVVQIAGALALRRGFLVELATGEGKTLVASLAAVAAAWSGMPCHVVTVNDYLAERDAKWMAPVYRFCGVTVGHVTGPMDPAERRENYARDLTYCTGKELVADLLRDRLRLGLLQHPIRRQLSVLLRPDALSRAGLVLRGLHTAIVDEADSVLVDEAVTPVIISSAHGNAPLEEAYQRAGEIAADQQRGVDYRVDRRYKEVELTDAGRERIRGVAGALPGLWRGESRREELVRQALNAREFFASGKQYVIQDGKVVIVDEFTGRMMPQRTWRAGLHQAVEAKEGLEVSGPTETMARLSFQRFFRFFRRLSGMTGTGTEVAAEAWFFYRMPTVAIPTNKPCVRRDLPDRVFVDEGDKWDAVVEDIERIHATGRPILVGTRSVTASEHLSVRLTAAELPHRVLNAVRHREEAQVVAGAGGVDRITIATNMAGRGTDIKLANGVAGLGGLHVLSTERHESRRIDRQLFGRSGRQGDPGSSRAFISADDELLKRFLPEALRLRLKSGLQRRLPGAERLTAFCVDQAQAVAQRLAYRQRRGVLRMDTWLEDALSFTGQE